MPAQVDCTGLRILASVDLAKEKGRFPRCFEKRTPICRRALNAAEWMMMVRRAIAENGIRNALLTSIAPRHNQPSNAGNGQLGDRPVFAYAYARNGFAKRPQLPKKKFVDYAVQMWRRSERVTRLARLFVNAQYIGTLWTTSNAQAAAQQMWGRQQVSRKTSTAPRRHQL